MSMKRVLPLLLVFAGALLMAQSSLAQANSAELNKVLSAMDSAAASFRSAQASFVWNTFQPVVNETETQKGIIYFRKNKGGLEMAADVNVPANQASYVLFTGGKIQMYNPRIDQVQQFDTGKHREVAESFLVLGYGGRGHDLLKQFDVKYEGIDNVGGVQAARLMLVPKSARFRSTFDRIQLWIDQKLGVALQQKFMDSNSGSWKLVTFSNIRLNQGVPNSAFKLNTTGKTKVVKGGA